MKKLMMIAAMVLMSTGAFAQEMFIKPMVGGTLTTLTGDASDDAKMKVGLVAGAEFGYLFNENMGVTAGVLYSMQGCKSKAMDENMNLDYLNIPILFNYYVAPGLALKAGIQPGFLTRAKVDGHDYKDYYKKIDLAIPMGASYEISDFVIDARYNLGAIFNIADYGDSKTHNSVIQLTVGYKIPF
jgi:hypothetical protein